MVSALVVCALVYAGVVFGIHLHGLERKTAANKAEYAELVNLESNHQQLEQQLKLINYKIGDVENALPANLMQERILQDIYRARYAISDFSKVNLTVNFLGREELPDAAEGDGETRLVKESMEVGFASTYEKIKAFILELENTPRTYKVAGIDLQKGTGQDVACVLRFDAYGAVGAEDERAVINEVAYEWFSPTQKGKTDVFQAQTSLTDIEFNQKIFDAASPTSYYKNFTLNINSKDESKAPVIFQQHRRYNSTLGGEYYNVTLNLTQVNDRYHYSFTLGNELYPPTGEAELTAHKGRDIIINVADDCALTDVALLKPVTLTITNKTDKIVRVTGATNKRLKIVGDTNVVKP
jgi:hypothetical protein